MAMNWKKPGIYLWPLLVWPGMIVASYLIWGLRIPFMYFWERFAQKIVVGILFEIAFPHVTVPVLLLVALTSYLWLRFPCRKAFLGTLLVNWGILGPFGMGFIAIAHWRSTHRYPIDIPMPVRLLLAALIIVSPYILLLTGLILRRLKLPCETLIMISKRVFIYLWPFLAWPGMAMAAYLLWDPMRPPMVFLRRFAQKTDLPIFFETAFLRVTVPILLMFALMCYLWLRFPCWVSFLGTLFVGWAILGPVGMGFITIAHWRSTPQPFPMDTSLPVHLLFAALIIASPYILLLPGLIPRHRKMPRKTSVS